MKIESFSGDYAFLSNFYPCLVPFEGIEYPTAEHAFQAAKTLDLAKRQEIAALPTPAEAKRAGRKLQLRPGWERVKFRMMNQIVDNKFTWNPDLRQLLIKTKGSELIEGNDWNDTFWGVCDGAGENRLGRILMGTREWMEGIDRWLRPKVLTFEEVAEERRQSAQHNLKAVGADITRYSCDDCSLPRVCALAFDSYNTDGDCLLDK